MNPGLQVSALPVFGDLRFIGVIRMPTCISNIEDWFHHAAPCRSRSHWTHFYSITVTQPHRKSASSDFGLYQNSLEISEKPSVQG